MYVIVNLPTSGTRLYDVDAETSGELIELAQQYLTSEGLNDALEALENADIGMIEAAFAVNTDDHADYFPTAESKTMNTFVEWLTEQDLIEAEENVLFVGEVIGALE